MISSQILLPLCKEQIFTNRQVKRKEPKRMKYGFSLVLIIVRLSSIKYPLSCDSIWLINTHDYQTSMKASGVMELWTKYCLASTYGRVHSIWRSCPECFVSVLFRIHSP
jgi:hypothetical protein